MNKESHDVQSHSVNTTDQSHDVQSHSNPPETYQEHMNHPDVIAYNKLDQSIISDYEILKSIYSYIEYYFKEGLDTHRENELNIDAIKHKVTCLATDLTYNNIIDGISSSYCDDPLSFLSNTNCDTKDEIIAEGFNKIYTDIEKRLSEFFDSTKQDDLQKLINYDKNLDIYDLIFAYLIDQLSNWKTEDGFSKSSLFHMAVLMNSELLNYLKNNT